MGAEYNEMWGGAVPHIDFAKSRYFYLIDDTSCIRRRSILISSSSVSDRVASENRAW